MLHLLFYTGLVVGGAILGAGGLAAFKAKFVTDVKALLADLKAEATKIGSSTIVTKIEAFLKKL